jgi:hypothetical protein
LRTRKKSSAGLHYEEIGQYGAGGQELKRFDPEKIESPRTTYNFFHLRALYFPWVGATKTSFILGLRYIVSFGKNLMVVNIPYFRKY